MVGMKKFELRYPYKFVVTKPRPVEAVRVVEDMFSASPPNPLHLPGLVYSPLEKKVFAEVLLSPERAQVKREGWIGDWVIYSGTIRRQGCWVHRYSFCTNEVFRAVYREMREVEGEMEGEEKRF
jgi:hypothetical protein